MTTLFLAVLLAFAGTAAGYGQETRDSDTRSKIITLENIWNQAAEAKDLKALNAILDEGFVYVDRDGRLLKKADVLADVLASPPVQVSSEAMIVRLHGDTAVVTGVYQIKGTERGKPFVRRDRFVDTWHQTRGTWTSIASLTTPMGT